MSSTEIQARGEQVEAVGKRIWSPRAELNALKSSRSFGGLAGVRTPGRKQWVTDLCVLAQDQGCGCRGEPSEDRHLNHNLGKAQDGDEEDTGKVGHQHLKGGENGLFRMPCLEQEGKGSSVTLLPSKGTFMTCSKPILILHPLRQSNTSPIFTHEVEAKRLESGTHCTGSHPKLGIRTRNYFYQILLC